LVASCQAFLSGRGSFYACRSLLGLIEGGFIPDTILYLSYWYKGNELPRRLSFFWTSYQFTSIVGAFLAYGILHMNGINGMAGWRWLFALEGTLTGLIGIATYFYMPPSPTQTASRFRGKAGWFTEHEEKIMVNRVLRDDPSKGDMHNRQAVTPRLLYHALKDWEMFPVYLIGLSMLIPNTPVCLSFTYILWFISLTTSQATAYLSLTIKSLDFTTFQTNLLTIPAYVLFIVNLLFWTWFSEKTNQRFLTGLTSQLWCLPLLIILEFLGPGANRWGRYVLSILLVGAPYVHAINVAITSRNAGSVRTRTVASALYNMTVQASNVIASQIYRTDDKPLYRTGNKVLIAITCYNILLFIGAKFFYVWRNSIREKRWAAMSQEERETYLATTTDKGNKLLTFRFAS
jgi:Major Facilitator Superfamily